MNVVKPFSNWPCSWGICVGPITSKCETESNLLYIEWHILMKSFMNRTFCMQQYRIVIIKIENTYKIFQKSANSFRKCYMHKASVYLTPSLYFTRVTDHMWLFYVKGALIHTTRFSCVILCIFLKYLNMLIFKTWRKRLNVFF